MYRFILTLVVALLSGITLRAQENMSLSDCIEYALNSHSDIRIAELSMKDAEWQIKENRSVAYPQIGLGVHLNHFLLQPALPTEALGFGDSVTARVARGGAGRTDCSCGADLPS